MSRAAFILLLALPILVGQMCVSVDPTGSDPAIENPDTGSSVPPETTARTLSGPGFSLELPAGFESRPDVAVPTDAVFRAAYGDGQRLITVSTHAPDADGLYTFESPAIRVQSGQTSDSGDFVLISTLYDPSLAGEDPAGYALLADGSLLCVQVSSGGTLSAEDEAIATALFRSLSLDDTNGTALTNAMAAQARKLLGRTSNGLIVLDDLSAWALDGDATAAEWSELGAWTADGSVHVQDAEGGQELVMIGRWSAIPVNSLGLAIETQLAGYDVNARRISFLNGLSQGMPYSDLPQFWKSGDDVLILRDRPYDWVVRRQTWHWLRM